MLPILLLAQFCLGGIGSRHVFRDGLPTAHHAARCVKGIDRAIMQRPAL